MAITKEFLKLFREDFAEAVKGLEEKYGLELSIGSISYSDKEFHTKLTAEIAKSEEEKTDEQKKKWELFCRMHPQHKLTVDSFGKTFVCSDGKKYKLVDCKPNAPKNNLVIESQNGTQYVASIDFLFCRI